MCGSSQPAPQPKAPDNNYWSWWNFQDSKNNLGGNYRLNQLAIGDVLKTSKGTSNLKNIRTDNRKSTTGTRQEPQSVTNDRIASQAQKSFRLLQTARNKKSTNKLSGILTTISTGRSD